MPLDAVDRTVAILEQLARHPDGVGIMRMADRLGLAPSTLHRYLASLQQHRIVRQDEGRSYRLTPRLYLLGLGAAKGFDLEAHAKPSLERLARASGETVGLMVREGDQAVCIEKIDSDHPLAIQARIGSSADLRQGATGRVLLAFAPEEVREEMLARPPLPKRTPHTVTDPNELRRLLEAVRRDGHYVSRSQVDGGAVAVAAPVRDRAGEVIAAVAVVGPQTRLAEGPVLSRTIDLVEREVGALSEHLGYAEDTRQSARLVTGRGAV